MVARRDFLALTYSILLLAITQSCFGQATLQFCWEDNNGDQGCLESNHIAGDFGRRECCANKFHKGVDISPAGADADLGYSLISPVAGTITRIDKGTGYKKIVIDGPGNQDFGYGHIFTDFNVGGLPLVIDEGNDEFVLMDGGVDYAVIIVNPGPNGMAYTDSPNNLNVTYDGLAYVATNQVNAGDRISPLGTSGNFPAHVHLYLFQNPSAVITDHSTINNSKDPLLYVQHLQPNYVIEVMNIKDNYAGTGPKPHNYNVKTKVSFGPVTGGNGQYGAGGAIMDMNKMELFLKKDNPSADFSTFQGGYFESRISEGGIVASADIRYPSHGNPANNTSGGDNTAGTGQGIDIGQTKTNAATIAQFGGPEHTGIIGQAYTGAYSDPSINPAPALPWPWDIFYFNDFPTRIRDNDNYGRNQMLEARITDEARFQDGKYLLKARATDIFGVATESAEQAFTIDNFRPYVQTIDIYAANTLFPSIETPVYHAGRVWNATSGELKLTPNSLDGGGVNRILDMVNPATDQLRVVVKYSEPMTTGTIAVPTLVNPVPPLPPAQMVPSSISADQTTYEWYISNSFLVGNTVAMQNLRIGGTDLSGNQLLGYGENHHPVSGNNIPHRIGAGTGPAAWSAAGPASGIDNTHWFKFFLCQQSEVQYNGGNNAAPTSPCIVPDFSANVVSGEAPLEVEFTDHTSSAAPITSWLWYYGDGSSQSGEGPHWHTYTSPGWYTVRLTVTDDAGESDFEEKVQYIYVTESGTVPTGSIEVDFIASPTDPYVGSETVDFTDLTVNASGNLSYAWEFPGGNPSSANAQNVYNVVYPVASSYDVTLTVTENGVPHTLTKPQYINPIDNSVPIEFSDPCFSTYPDPSVTGAGVYVPGQFISFTPNYISGGTSPYTYFWRFENTNGTLLGTVNGYNATYSFPSIGTYNAILIVDDANPNTIAQSCTLEVFVGNAHMVTGLTIQGNLYNTQPSADPISVGNTNQTVYFSSEYTGTPSNLHYYWEVTKAGDPSWGPWITHYYDEPNFSVPANIGSSAVGGWIGSGSWNVRLRLETNLNPPVWSNTIQVSVGNPPSSSLPVQLTGINLSANFGPNGSLQPNGLRGQCYYEDAPNLFIAPGVVLGSEPYFAGDNGPMVQFGGCWPTDEYLNCAQCDYTYVKANIISGVESQYLIGGTDGDWWKPAVCPEASPSGNQTFGRLNLNNYSWNQPWIRDVTMEVWDENFEDLSEDAYNWYAANPEGNLELEWPSLYNNLVQSKPAMTETITVYRCLTEADAGPDLFACPGTTISALSGEPQSGTKPSHTYHWSFPPGEGIPGIGITEYLSDPNILNPIVTVPNGQVTLQLTVTDAFGNSATDLVTITGTPVLANAGQDINLCLGNSVSLNGSASGGAGTGYTYSWYPAVGLNNATVQNPLFTASVNGVYAYTLTVTDENGCIDTDVVTIHVDDNKPVVAAGEDMVSCPGGYLTLGLNVTGGGTGSYSYVWSPNTPTDFLEPNGALSISAQLGNTAYHVTVTDDNGCSGDDWISVFIDNDLSEGVVASSGVPVGNILEVCPMGSFELVAQPSIPGNYDYEWSWEFEGTSWSAQGSPLTTGTMWDQTYFLEARNTESGCISWDEIDVAVDPQLGPSASIASDQAVCYGQSLAVTGTASGGLAPYSYQWFVGPTDLYEVLFNPATSASAYATGSSASIQYADAEAYLANNGSSTVDVHLLVTDGNGCVGLDEVDASLGSEIEISGMWHRSYGCAGESLTIGGDIVVSGGNLPYTYEWIHPTLQFSDPYSLITTIVPDHSAFLELEVTDAIGCSIVTAGLSNSHRYKAVFIFEETGNELRFESLAGHYCVGDIICTDEDVVSAYMLNFDHDIAVSQGLYNGNYNGLSQQFSMGLSPTMLINAAFVHYRSQYLSYNGLDPSIQVQPSGCLLFNNPGLYSFEVNYQLDVGISTVAQPACAISISQQIEINVEPEVTFPPEPETVEHVTGLINLPSPQNDKHAVILKVAIDESENSVSTVVSSGIQADHVAVERVSIRPGFSAMSGSDYTAKLNPCMEFADGKLVDESAEEDTMGYATRSMVLRDSIIDLRQPPSEAEFFNVYPNPNTGDFTVSCSNLKKLIVFDASGRIVWDSNQTFSSDSDQSEANVLLSGFSNGIYIVKAERKNGATRFRKVVVQ